MCEVLLTNHAIKDLKNLNETIQKLIKEKLKDYSSNPSQYAKKLTDPIIGEYRFRIGDYRIIFDIQGNDIIVLRIGHRKDIYR
jgi:mRNA interferase RelE/StbE